jgi:hypothetical protein
LTGWVTGRGGTGRGHGFSGSGLTRPGFFITLTKTVKPFNCPVFFFCLFKDENWSNIYERLSTISKLAISLPIVPFFFPLYDCDSLFFDYHIRLSPLASYSVLLRFFILFVSIISETYFFHNNFYVCPKKNILQKLREFN